MTAEDFDALLTNAGISLPGEELHAALPGAKWLLDVANQLPAPDQPSDLTDD